VTFAPVTFAPVTFAPIEGTEEDIGMEEMEDICKGKNADSTNAQIFNRMSIFSALTNLKDYYE